MTSPKLQIAELLDVTKQRVDQLRHRDDFQEPVERWARGDLWSASDVRRWGRGAITGRRGGRSRGAVARA